MRVSSRAVGFALVLFAALTWSSAGVGIKVLWPSALAVSGFRSLFALPVVLAFAIVSFGEGGVALGLRAARRPAVLGAALAYALTVLLFVSATKLTTAANAILLQYTAPIYVALLSWPLLREPLRKSDGVAVVGCLVGIGWFFRERVSAEGALGNGLALLAGVGFALVPLLMRYAQKRGDDEARVSALVAIVVGNVMVVVGTAPWMAIAPPPDLRSWAVVAALGVGQLGMSYVAYSAGVARVRAVEAILVATIEPILNPIWVALATGERPSGAAVVGGAIILVSVAAQGVFASRASYRSTLAA